MTARPGDLTVIIEDTAALVGLTLAFLGTLLNQILGWHQETASRPSPSTRLLAVVAVMLIVGKQGSAGREGANLVLLRSSRALVLSDEVVKLAGHPMNIYFGPQSILLTINVRFRQAIQRDGIE